MDFNLGSAHLDALAEHGAFNHGVAVENHVAGEFGYFLGEYRAAHQVILEDKLGGVEAHLIEFFLIFHFDFS